MVIEQIVYNFDTLIYVWLLTYDEKWIAQRFLNAKYHYQIEWDE